MIEIIQPKPCPICGEEPFVHADDVHCVVFCPECESPAYIEGATYQEAVAAWNERADQYEKRSTSGWRTKRKAYEMAFNVFQAYVECMTPAADIDHMRESMPDGDPLQMKILYLPSEQWMQRALIKIAKTCVAKDVSMEEIAMDALEKLKEEYNGGKA